MKRKSIIYLSIFIGFIISLTFAIRSFLSDPSYHTVIPIEFSTSNIPLTYVKIEDKEYPLLLDTGSKFSVSLRKNFLENLHEKETHEMVNWKDYKGNSYEAPSYILPEMEIGNILLDNIIVQQEDDDFILNTTLYDSENKGKSIVDKKTGSIGRPILQKLNLLLDYDQNVIFASNNLHKLHEAGYSLNKMIKVPFTMERLGITFSIDTDLGVKRFVLDTGCSVNVLRSALIIEDNIYELGTGNLPVYNSRQFKIKGKDFGPMQFYLCDITPELNEIDGFLGTTFLYKRVVYIDFSKNQIYISDKV